MKTCKINKLANLRFGVNFGFFNCLRKFSQKCSQNLLTGRNGGFGFELSTTNYKLANETKILTLSQFFSIFDFFFEFRIFWVGYSG